MEKIFRKSLFSPKFEKMNLLIPIVLLILVIFECVYQQNFLNGFSRFEVSILANIVFLNITHNAFTVVLLTSNLPLKKWVDHHGGEKKFWITQSLILLSLTLFFSLILFFSYQYRIAFVAFVLIGFFFAAHHALSQTFGLSLVYSRESGSVEALKSERSLFTIFMTLNLTAGAFFILYNYKIISMESGHFYNCIKWMCFFILATGIGLVVHPLFFLQKEYWSKSIFNLRYLLWPLTLISSTAIFSTLVTHGVEYGLVTEKMIKGQSMRRPVAGIALIIAVIILAVIRLESLGSINAHQELSVWLIAATGLSVGFSFHHYYLDRKLFKMRLAVNRELVGTMLFKDPLNVGQNNGK